jgi:hypothetical protein
MSFDEEIESKNIGKKSLSKTFSIVFVVVATEEVWD